MERVWPPNLLTAMQATRAQRLKLAAIYHVQANQVQMLAQPKYSPLLLCLLLLAFFLQAADWLILYKLMERVWPLNLLTAMQATTARVPCCCSS
jgi:hypothetical protein